jgi:NhaP-type Na+/H+ or K+/H+ antiporter
VAVVCYFAADGGGGSGFIAAFVAGAAVRAGYGEAGSHGAELSEDWGQLLAWFVFFVFGLVVVDIWDEFTLSMFAYAALSLTVIRMLPVAIALAGTGLHRTTVLFMGWFGPRGLASVVLGLVFLEKEANLAGTEEITTTIALTVLLSIIAHGVTAAPGIHLYARAVRGLPPDAPELQAPGGIQEQASTAG